MNLNLSNFVKTVITVFLALVIGNGVERFFFPQGNLLTYTVAFVGTLFVVTFVFEKLLSKPKIGG